MNKAVRCAALRGAEAGRNAAHWAIHSIVGSPEALARVADRILQGIKDNDPAILGAFDIPRPSGEYAAEDDLRRAWEDAAQQAFWREIESAARALRSLHSEAQLNP